jgi:type I restriction enzyme M protein
MTWTTSRLRHFEEQITADAGTYSLILANPPFAGSLDYEVTAKDLQQIVKTKKTELLFIALFLRLLKTGGGRP